MRTTFFVLLLVNLFFWGWAQWIAAPPSAADSLVGVPRLQLVARDLPQLPNAAAVHAPAGALGAALAGKSSVVQSGPAGAPSLQCVSVGPFARQRAASGAQTLLFAQHLNAQLRTAAVQPARWYWVYVPDVSGAARVRQELAALRRDGINGAEPMPTADGKPGISLGLFRDPARAHQQLTRSRTEGFPAELSARLVAQPAYWLDVWAAGGAGALPMAALHTAFGATLGTLTCPSGAAPPLPTQGPGAVTPGLPLPADQASAEPSP